jgi:outer membrane protein assembly factor BamE (lipoprotein component of BamABCDE complex)
MVMAARLGRAGGAAAVVTLLLGGCSQVRDHKGYVVDSVLIDSVQPGVDNRDSVQKTLGRPSFESEFDKGATWYYLSRDTRQLAFSTPKAVKQVLLTVRFAPSGDVASVQKTGTETIRRVALYDKKTPTLGSNKGFIAELFGNIGTVGSSQSAPTADNPEG